jgi:flagellar biosynthesis/type III secretory pathway M-ring protein FliF/YscJ
MSGLLQVAIPLPPPPPQVDPNLVSAHTQESILIALTIIAISIGVFFLLKPLVQALARRLEGRSADQALHEELMQLRDQLGEVETLRGRLQELEERLEFAERLLAQRRDQDLLPRGEQRG